MIKYDRLTKDYTVTLDGEYIGSRGSYSEALALLTQAKGN
jgi:hypothetical protein